MASSLTLKNGTEIPKIGQGTWYLGEPSGDEKEEIATFQLGVELGLNLIDTAEMYGSGRSERLIGKAISTISREKLLLVSKVYPQNAGKKNLEKSLDQSLGFLGTDYLDLYLLHWRGSVPLAETVDCMEEMVQKGKIRGWGVSNFDIKDMKELESVPKGENCQVNQVLYHLGSRGVEFDLLPYLQEKNIPLMAYCPLAQAGDLKKGLLQHETVVNLSKKHEVSPTTILLAFLLQEEKVFAIPKSSKQNHVKENVKALTLQLSKEDMTNLRQYFPKLRKKEPLDIV